MDIGDSDGICVSMWEQKRNTDQLIFTLNLHDGCIRLSLLKEIPRRYVAGLKGERDGHAHKTTTTGVELDYFWLKLETGRHHIPKQKPFPPISRRNTQLKSNSKAGYPYHAIWIMYANLPLRFSHSFTHPTTFTNMKQITFPLEMQLYWENRITEPRKQQTLTWRNRNADRFIFGMVRNLLTGQTHTHANSWQSIVVLGLFHLLHSMAFFCCFLSVYLYLQKDSCNNNRYASNNLIVVVVVDVEWKIMFLQFHCVLFEVKEGGIVIHLELNTGDLLDIWNNTNVLDPTGIRNTKDEVEAKE